VATSSSPSGTAAASKGGLSAGAGAGIAVAALLVFAGLAIGAFVFWWKRPRPAVASIDEIQEPGPVGGVGLNELGNGSSSA